MDTWNSLIMKALRRFIDTHHEGNVKSAAQELGVNYQTLITWYNGKKSPKLESISPLMELLGFPLPTSAPTAPNRDCDRMAKEIVSLQQQIEDLRNEVARLKDRENELLRELLDRYRYEAGEQRPTGKKGA